MLPGVLFLSFALSVRADDGAYQRAVKAEAARIEERVQQAINDLATEDADVSKKAEEELIRLGLCAKEELTITAESLVPEIQEPAVRLLERLEGRPAILQDAEGHPIPFASVTADLIVRRQVKVANFPDGGPDAVQREHRVHVTTMTDRTGRVALGNYKSGRGRLTIHSPQIGSAEMDIYVPPNRPFRFPLVQPHRPVSERAIKGVVVDTGGQPIAGARVACQVVRSPGMGLFQAADPYGKVLTNNQGEFALYIPVQENRFRDNERGKLIPPGSRFELTVSLPDDRAVSPAGGHFNNTAPARIVLNTKARLHRFDFETHDGHHPTDPKRASEFRVVMKTIAENESRMHHAIELDQALNGIRLVPGTYHASRHSRYGTIEYQPLTVTESSPEVLTFLLPDPKTYEGRVVDGATGEPIPGAFVIGQYSSGNGSLAMLTPQQWQTLYRINRTDDLDSEQIKILDDYFGARALVRSGKDGTFSITEAIDRPFYGLVAFSEDTIPYRISQYQYRDRETNEWQKRDFPLFKAATVTVRVHCEQEGASTNPGWRPEVEGQPEWYDRFRQAMNPHRGRFGYDSWMVQDQQQPIYVPAGIRLKLRLSAPYEKEFAYVTLPEVFDLKPGENRVLEDVTLPRALPVQVRVFDPQGKRVEGAPVTRMHDDDNGWCVSHNTDEQGLATMYVNPNSTGRIRVGDFYRRDPEIKMAFASFDVGDTPPAPIDITLTAIQHDAIFSAASQ